MLNRIFYTGSILLVFLINPGCGKEEKQFETITKCLEEKEIDGKTICASLWKIVSIDSKGSDPSIAIDWDGNVHIIYDYSEDNTHYLKYVTNSSGKWEGQILDELDIHYWYIDWLIDSKGYVHIIYTYLGNDGMNFKHAIITENGLEINLIDCSEQPSFFIPSISSENNIIIVYIDYNQMALKDGYVIIEGFNYARIQNDECQIYKTVKHPEIQTGTEFSFTLDKKNNIHIAYGDKDGFLTYSTNLDSNWMTQRLPARGSIMGLNPDIVLDSFDNVYISYLSDEFEVSPHSRYITNASGTWQSYLFPRLGEYPLLVYNPVMTIDSKGNVYIAFNYGDEPCYAINSEGEWRIYKFGDYLDGILQMKIDSKDYLHIVSEGKSGIKYATNAP